MAWNNNNTFYVDWNNSSFTGTITGGTSNTSNYWYVYPSVSGVITYSSNQPLQQKEKKKMTEYVVEKSTPTGTERKTLVVGVTLDGVSASLSEGETEQLAQLVCKLLTLVYIGRA